MRQPSGLAGRRISPTVARPDWDAILLNAGFAGDGVHEADALARKRWHHRGYDLTEMTQQGAAFVRVLIDVWGHDLPDLPYPFAFGGGLHSNQGLPVEQGRTCSWHALCQRAGLRRDPCGAFGQTDGSGDHRARPFVHQTVTLALYKKPFDDIGSRLFSG